MKKCLRLCILGLVLILVGCATPPAVKQAVVNLDNGYDQNLKLMKQFNALAEQNTLRYKKWVLYVQNRAYLDLALLWATSDPKVPDIDPQEFTQSSLKRLGPEVIRVVNQIRLKDLPARTTPNNPSPVFTAGSGDMTQLVEGLPALVIAVQKKVLADNEPSFRRNTSAFEQYEANVTSLRQINAAIGRYLEIDVTVRPEDINSIADSVHTLTK